METDLRSRVVALEQSTTANGQRITTLETWQRQREVSEAGKDAEWRGLIAQINTRFTSLEAQIREVSGTLKWINKIVIGAVAAGFIAFMLKGGLHIP